MPWTVVRDERCPSIRPFAVLKESDRSVAGCHPTRAKARAQQEALYSGEAKAFDEALHPRDWHGRFASVMGLSGTYHESSWNQFAHAAAEKAVRAAINRSPELLEEPRPLRAVGFASGVAPGRGLVRQQEWNDLRAFVARSKSVAATSINKPAGPIVMINDKLPFGVPTAVASPATRSAAGVVTHEIGHAWFAHYGVSDKAAAARLLEEFRILPGEIGKVSRYAASDPREALAELYTMYHVPGFREKLPERLRRNYGRLEAAMIRRGPSQQPLVTTQLTALIDERSPLWPEAQRAIAANLDADAWVAVNPELDALSG